MTDPDTPFHVTVLCGDDRGGANIAMKLGFNEDPAETFDDEKTKKLRDAGKRLFREQFGGDPESVIVAFD